MFIELVDALRCPNAHEESWLVASATRMEARHIVDGTLGCPVCATEYPIRQGVVDFRRGPGQPIADSLAVDDELPMRIAALLDLTDANGFVVLCGSWGAAANMLATVVELPIVLADPPESVTGAPGISVIRCDGPLPLAPGTARAMALDAAGSERTASAIRATRTKGRVLADAALPLPAGVTELARDDRMWVGEREPAPSPLITLHVRRG
jgi:uncharacterized protein YbaR (Trm112 family)